MSFPGIIFADYPTQAHRLNGTVALHPLGQRLQYPDGRIFRFVLCGGTTLVNGDLIQGKASVAGDIDLVVQTAAAVGDTTVSITAQGSAVANFYAKGWAVVNKPALTGGYVHKVKSHPVFAAATKVITFEADDPIRVALDTSAEFSFSPNAYDAVVVAPQTTLTSRMAGVACTPITNAKYGFLQTGGVCGVNAPASTIIGNYGGTDLATSGRTSVSITDIDEQIGIYLTAVTTAGEYALMHLLMDR